MTATVFPVGGFDFSGATVIFGCTAEYFRTSASAAVTAALSDVPDEDVDAADAEDAAEAGESALDWLEELEHPLATRTAAVTSAKAAPPTR